MRFKRSTLLFFLVLFVYGFSFSQELVKEGHQWNVANGSFWHTGVSTELTKIIGDTIINDTIYNKLYSTSDTLDTNWELRNELLREDSIGRVYTKDIESGQENLLFDFSLQLNDTFSVYLGSYAFPDHECLAVVSNIDSVTINNGEKRKRLHFKVGWDFNDQGPIWVEGIGSTRGGLFGDIVYCVSDLLIDLNCFYDKDELLYPELPTSCFIDIPIAVQYALPSDINIYPNPISKTLYISHGETKIESYKIIDFMGRFVKASVYTKTDIDVSSIPVGIYVLVIEAGDGRLYSHKLIKQD